MSLKKVNDSLNKEEKAALREWLQGEVLRRVTAECLEEGREVDIVTGRLIENGQD